MNGQLTLEQMNLDNKGEGGPEAGDEIDPFMMGGRGRGDQGGAGLQLKEANKYMGVSNTIAQQMWQQETPEQAKASGVLPQSQEPYQEPSQQRQY